MAAQSARDRKKLRMEELECQISELTQQMKTTNELVDNLVKQNEILEEKNDELSRRLSNCVCNSSNSTSQNNISSDLERKTPVCSVTEKSAALPQPRAVTLQAAAIRALFLTALCCQTGPIPLSGSALKLRQKSLKRLNNFKPKSSLQLIVDPLDLSSDVDYPKWSYHHQPPWKEEPNAL